MSITKVRIMVLVLTINNSNGLHFKGGYISGSVLSASHIFTHLILIITLGDRRFLLNLNFADERNGGTLSYASKAVKSANGKA